MCAQRFKRGREGGGMREGGCCVSLPRGEEEEVVVKEVEGGLGGDVVCDVAFCEP